MVSILTSCNVDCVHGNGQEATIEVALDDFQSISGNSSIDVILIQGNESKAIITGDSNLVNMVELDLNGDRLDVGYLSNSCVISKLNMQVALYINEDFNGIKINGSGNVNSKKGLELDELEIDINGSGDVALEADIEDLEISIHGSGNVFIEGRGDVADISINGSGDISLYDFDLDELDVSINGSGDVEASVNDALKVNINGSGNVYYKGNAKTEIRENGSGNVVKK